MSLRLRVGPLSVSSRGRVGVSVGPLSASAGGYRRRGGRHRSASSASSSEAGALGAVVGLLVLLGLVVMAVEWYVKHWQITVPITVLVGCVVGIVLRLRHLDEMEKARLAELQAQKDAALAAERAAAEHRAAIERAALDDERRRQALREWLAAPAPDLFPPTRFTEAWFADYVPAMHPGQVPQLETSLRARGWKNDKIEARLGPHLSRNPYLQPETPRRSVEGTGLPAL